MLIVGAVCAACVWSAVAAAAAEPIPPIRRSCVFKFHRATRSEDYDYDYEQNGDGRPSLNVSIPLENGAEARRCAPNAEYCYAHWTEGPDGKITVLSQGCWVQADRHNSCDSLPCRSDGSPSAGGEFCCCKADLCNASPSSAPSPPPPAPSPRPAAPVADPSPAGPVPSAGSIATLVGASLVGLSVLACFFVKFATGSKKMNAEGGGADDVETGGPGFSCSNMCADNLKLHDNIGSGRHAKVWRGSLGGVPVAVKALPSARTNLWLHERDVYCLPHMRHSNLLQYFGCDTRPTLEGPPEHLLVLQLAPLGSLRNFLAENTLDWDVYTNMSLGIASALAHLHTHIEKDGQYKPCIVHRDVNSSNIVVRADLTCCLSDLGLAMPLPDCKSQNVQNQYRIQEAGTLRYLAPEALEGSLDLRRCAASLRAVDVYALALVLWELLSRCAALHRIPGPPAYAPPFQNEVGDQPTLERMQVIVARCKARPLFSPRLLPVRATRLARDTCEDCWDHDAEARLTAVCVVERLTELKNMRPASSPTINSNDLRPPTQDHSSNWHSPGSCEDKNSNLNSSFAFNSNPSILIDFQANMLNKLPLQPHQGRNPCLERNLASVGPDDHLIDKSLKDMPSNSSSSPPANSHGSNDYIRTDLMQAEQNLIIAPQDFSRIEEPNVNGFLRNSNRQNGNFNQNSFALNQDDLQLPNHDEQLLNDLRPLTRPLTPIGYVQNDVSSDINGLITSNGDANPYGYPAKKSNISQEVVQPKWGAKHLKKLFDSKLFKKKNTQTNPVPLETEVNFILSNGKPINNGQLHANGKYKTSIIANDARCKINRDDFTLMRNESSTDRPSSLPGLDSVTSNATTTTDCSLQENVSLKPISNSEISRINMPLEHNTCMLSPPNRTIKINDHTKMDNLIAGFRELPTTSGERCPNSNISSQVFSVIVPKSYSAYPQKHLLSSKINESKIEDKLLKADNCELEKYSSKRFSCDESIYNRSNMYFKINNDASINRNSYSGEASLEPLCKNDCGDVNVDYSSNSEDEHMLLLSENGGSKITMRQRFDIKSSQDSNRRSQTISPHEGAISKIAAGSFSSLCQKYGSKNKYENLHNQSNSLPKDASFSGNYRNKLSLSICKQNLTGVNINESIDNDETVIIKNQSESTSTDDDDDETFPDEVFSAKSANTPFKPLSIKQNLSRQHSLELVNELFSSSADLSRLKDPASRIKTPGDVPASVRKMRGSLGSTKIRRTGSAKETPKTASNRLSLYDDRMMFGNSL